MTSVFPQNLLEKYEREDIVALRDRMNQCEQYLVLPYDYSERLSRHSIYYVQDWQNHAMYFTYQTHMPYNNTNSTNMGGTVHCCFQPENCTATNIR